MARPVPPDDDPAFLDYLSTTPVRLPRATRPATPTPRPDPVTSLDIWVAVLAALSGALAAVLVWVVVAYTHDYALTPQPRPAPAPHPSRPPASSTDSPVAPVPISELFPPTRRPRSSASRPTTRWGPALPTHPSILSCDLSPPSPSPGSCLPTNRLPRTSHRATPPQPRHSARTTGRSKISGGVWLALVIIGRVPAVILVALFLLGVFDSSPIPRPPPLTPPRPPATPSRPHPHRHEPHRTPGPHPDHCPRPRSRQPDPGGRPHAVPHIPPGHGSAVFTCSPTPSPTTHARAYCTATCCCRPASSAFRASSYPLPPPPSRSS